MDMKFIEFIKAYAIFNIIQIIGISIIVFMFCYIKLIIDTYPVMCKVMKL